MNPNLNTETVVPILAAIFAANAIEDNEPDVALLDEYGDALDGPLNDLRASLSHDERRALEKAALALLVDRAKKDLAEAFAAAGLR